MKGWVCYMTGGQVYDIAHNIGSTFFNNNMMEIVGAVVVGNDIYIRGFDGGFPHAACIVRFDIKTGKIIKSWGYYDCPVTVENGVYKQRGI